MSGNLLSTLVAWLASHLVVLSLLAYLVVGLFVFGVVEVPATVSWMAGIEKSAANGEGRRAPPPKTAEVRLAPRARPTEPGDGTRRVPSSQPRLIGGTLPIREPAHWVGVDPVPGQGLGGDGFRPPQQSPAPVAAREDYLQQARRAFWNGEFEAAEVAYMDLIAAFPADPDAFGELGNLYQSMGRDRQALDAYFEAGIRLKAVGARERLDQVIEILRKDGDDRAALLVP